MRFYGEGECRACGEGPIYGTKLDVPRVRIGDSNMWQATPSEHELRAALDEYHERLVAAYEVLLWHYRRSIQSTDLDTPDPE